MTLKKTAATDILLVFLELPIWAIWCSNARESTDAAVHVCFQKFSYFQYLHFPCTFFVCPKNGRNSTQIRKANNKMAAVAAMAVTLVEKSVEKTVDSQVESFMKAVTTWLKKNKQSLEPFEYKGSYIEFGRHMTMPFRKAGESKMVNVMQRTVRDIRLTAKLQRKGILRRIVEFLLSTEGGCKAVQLEAVQNPSLHVALKLSSEKQITLGVWHDQYISWPGFPDPQIGHSFVRFN